MAKCKALMGSAVRGLISSIFDRWRLTIGYAAYAIHYNKETKMAASRGHFSVGSNRRSNKFRHDSVHNLTSFHEIRLKTVRVIPVNDKQTHNGTDTGETLGYFLGGCND